ncbi:MAG: glycosyltransferase family 39 protein [Armatimonadota bacterium]
MRSWGLYWGLPDETHLFSYHPDEHFSLATALSVAFGGGWSPHYFNYGPLYMHLVAAVAAVANHLPLDGLESIETLMPKLILDARLVTVVLGVLTVPLVYLVGRNLYGRTAGLMAAVVLAIMPLHAVHGHFATVDVPATFWMVLCLVFASRILPHTGRRRRRGESRRFVPGRLYAVAGAAAGLAAATKYNAALALLFPLLAHALRHGRGGRDIGTWVRLIDRRTVLAVGGFLVAFIVACPYALLTPGEWWGSVESVQGVAYELHHMRTGEHLAVAATPPGIVFHLVGSLAYGLGWPTLLLSLAAVGLGLAKRRRRDWLLLSFLLLWYVSISLAQVRYMRYAIPLLPILALLVGRLLHELRERAAEPGLPVKRALLMVVRIAAVAALCHALLYTWAYDDAMAGLTGDGGPRAQCLPRAGAEAGDSIGLIWPPWFCHPPLEYVNGGHILGQHRVWRRFRRSRYDVRPIGFDLHSAEQLPSFFITTSFGVRYHERLGTPDWRNLQETLWSHYVGEVLYDPAAQLGRLPGADMHEAPADWLYPFPEIAVYRLDPNASPGRAEAAEGSSGPGVEATNTGS